MGAVPAHVGLAEADKALLWKHGRLRYLLHADQRRVYDKYRAWEAACLAARKRGEVLTGKWPRIFVFRCSRRWGKDVLSLIIKLEDCFRSPGARHVYATAHKNDISGIVIPLFEQLTRDCPANLKPIFRGSYQGTESGYYFPNKSVLKLVGVDINVDSLRGRYCDGLVVSEADYVSTLRDGIVNVMMPQLQGRLGATILLNSTPSREPGTFWKTDLTADAKLRDAFVKATIFDNPMLSRAERDEFIAAAGGETSEDFLREYLVEDIRSESTVVIPEFNPKFHVRDLPRPKYALGYTVIDPGVRDHCAVACGYYDFERAQLVIASDWSKPGANTNEVVAAVHACEKVAFEGLEFWDKTKFRQNPFLRFSDTDARMILDMNSLHDLKIGAADKDGAEAALNALRNAFATHRIVVHPNAVSTCNHLEMANWNPQRTSYARSAVFGHFDLLDVVKYMWRHVNKNTSPLPPYGVELGKTVNWKDLYFRKDHLRTSNGAADKLKSILPKGWRVRGRK